MSLAPIALILPQYEDYAGYWLKAYNQGTTTALSMATDATGATLLVKAPLDAQGFPITSSIGARFIPYIDGDFDLWLFPTKEEADANITVNAIQLSDDINADPQSSIVINAYKQYPTLSDLVADALLVVGKYVTISGRITNNDSGGNDYEIVPGGTAPADGGAYIDLPNTTPPLQAKGLFPGGITSVDQFGAVGDGVTDDYTSIQALINYLVANSPGVVDFSSKIYLIKSRLENFTGTGGVSFRGRGKKNSVILADAAITDGILWFLNTDNTYIKDIGFDSNNFNTTTLPTVKFNTCNNIEVSGCGFNKIPWGGISVEGCRDFRILNNTIDRDVAVNTENYGIIVASTAVQSRYGVISKNVCRKTIIGVRALDVVISDNHCSDYAYGSGIFTSPVISVSGRYTITGNTCMDGVGLDINGFPVKGMELGGDNSTVTGNICGRNAGYGIGWFGLNYTVSGNVCFNNGISGISNSDRAGLTARYSTATVNGNNASVSGNRCFDNSGTGGGGPQKYGYADHTTNNSGIYLTGNNFKGNDIDDYSILGTVGNAPSIYPRTIEASTIWDPGPIGTGSLLSVTLTASGAVIGDYVTSSLGVDIQNLILNSVVTSQNVVTSTLSNNTGGSVDLGSSTLRIRVIKATI